MKEYKLAGNTASVTAPDGCQGGGWERTPDPKMTKVSCLGALKAKLATLAKILST